MTRILPVLSAFALTACLEACALNQPRAVRTESQATAHLKDAAIIVETRNGGVEITAEKDRADVQVTAVITCGGATQAEADQRVKDAAISIQRDTSRALIIKPVFPAGTFGADGAKFTIRLPDATGITITTSNGAVATTGFSGELKVKTSNGSISAASQNGTADLVTSNGAVSVMHVSGAVQVKTSNGGVSVSDLGGPVDIQTSNGSISFGLSPGQSGPVRLASSNGGITATFGGSFNGVLKIDTSNGGVTIDDRAGRVKSKDMKKSSGTITIGEGGETSTIHTSNGGVRIETSS